METNSKIKDYFLMTIGSLMMSVGIYFFKLPYGFATGGVSGIGTLLGKTHLLNLTSSDWILLLNVIVLICGFFALGKELGARTIYCTLLSSGMNKVFEIFIPLDEPLTTQPLMELLIAMILTSIGSAMIFYAKGSSGGTDIIALIIQKHSALDVGAALLVVDFVVATTSLFISGIEIGLFSLLGVIIHSLLIDNVLESFNSNKVFMIITNKPDEIDDYLLNILHRSATIYEAKGAFSHQNKHIVQTVVDKKQAPYFQRKIKEIDPESFTIITKSIKVIGHNWASE